MSGGILLTSLMTKAEWGAVKLIPFKAHLALDFAVGLFTMSAPWVFNFADNAKARNTFLALGATSVLAASLSQPKEMDEIDL
jgi:uncharacterized membrane protein YGL010W